ncbi:MAG TPA: hypothetical protein HPP94_16195 [Desulfuromonadales bacterium]|nr:hypothetical protein [Desulfuromonadales bacterium]
MNEMMFLLLLFGLPGALGFYLARRRGKNPLLWGLLSAVFPFFLIVLHYQHKPVIKKDPDA